MIPVQNITLKVIFFLHFIFSIWGGQSSWVPHSYLFYNGLLLITVLWSLHSRDSEEGPAMALGLEFLSIFLDLVTFICFWGLLPVWNGVDRFGAICCVLNLIFRPVSAYLLFRIMSDRSGTYGNFAMPSGLGNIFGGGNSGRTPYEDIDQPTQQIPAGVSSNSDTARLQSASPDKLFSP